MTFPNLSKDIDWIVKVGFFSSTVRLEGEKLVSDTGESKKADVKDSTS